MGIQNVMVSHWLVQAFLPPHKSARPLFWYSWSYGITTYGAEVTSMAWLHWIS